MKAVELRACGARGRMPTHVHLDQSAVYLVGLNETIQLDQAELVEANLTLAGFTLVDARLDEVAEERVRRAVNALPVATLTRRLLTISVPQQLFHLMIVPLDRAK